MSNLGLLLALVANKAAPVPSGETYGFNMTLDRTFGITPAAGGGNVPPQTFEREGDTWQLWQVVPFLAGVGEIQRGDCRVQLRDTSIGRGQNLLENMPDRVTLSMADWTGLPWEFRRPTNSAKFTNAGSGNNARKAVDYEPTRAVGASPAAEGIAQGETFRVELHWD